MAMIAWSILSYLFLCNYQCTAHALSEPCKALHYQKFTFIKYWYGVYHYYLLFSFSFCVQQTATRWYRLNLSRLINCFHFKYTHTQHSYQRYELEQILALYNFYLYTYYINVRVLYMIQYLSTCMYTVLHIH